MTLLVHRLVILHDRNSKKLHFPRLDPKQEARPSFARGTLGNPPHEIFREFPIKISDVPLECWGIPRTQLTSIFEGQLYKRRPKFQSKQGSFWFEVIYIWGCLRKEPFFNLFHDSMIWNRPKEVLAVCISRCFEGLVQYIISLQMFLGQFIRVGRQPGGKSILFCPIHGGWSDSS